MRLRAEKAFQDYKQDDGTIKVDSIKLALNALDMSITDREFRCAPRRNRRHTIAAAQMLPVLLLPK